MEANNMAAMREAVEAVVRALSESNDVLSALLLMQAEAKCKAALSAPPRNCDVGTVEEQSERFKLFCNKRECVTCELNRISPFRYGCFSAWAQMPYEAY